MDMYNKQNDIHLEPVSHGHQDPPSPRISNRIFATNWGLAIIGGLIALAIGVSMLHNGYAESRAEMSPEMEQETVALLPLSE